MHAYFPHRNRAACYAYAIVVLAAHPAAAARLLMAAFVGTEPMAATQRPLGPGPRGLGDVSGSKVIAVPLKVVAEVLTSNQHRLDYEGGLIEATDLARSSEIVSGPGQAKDFMVYKVYHLPSPLNNRDYVFKCIWFEDKAPNGSLMCVLTEQSASHPSKPPAPDIVRGHVKAFYKLTELEPDKTECECVINVDPMGGMPTCIAVRYAAMYPGLMLKRINAQAVKTFKGRSS